MSPAIGRLQGKVALVTGGGQGIGRAVAMRFAGEAAAVLVGDVVEAKARTVAEEITRAGGRALGLAVDVTDPRQVEDMVAAARREFGRVNVLVTCAGVLEFGTAADTTLEKWNRVIGVNLTGTFLAAKAAIPAMIDSGGGAIVTISSSTGAHDASPGNVAYVASKGGVMMLTKAIALDHAASGIRANSIAPGPTATPMLQSVMTPKELERFGAAMPIGRLARPEEIAAAAVFLASDEASYVTGAVFAIDGGQTAKVGMTLEDLGTVSRQTA
jgi:NAD(P)-dependent dehydrogenase (short-subunit alcohol dehydrogenase family)